MTKKEILEQIKKNDVCVLATCLNNNTEAAVMSYVADDNFVFYMVTSKFYRKYKNISKNKNVSVVIGFGMPTFQIDGKVEFLKQKEIELIRPFMVEKLPEEEEFMKAKDVVFIKVIPSYLKVTKIVSGEYKVTELKF